MNIMNTMTHINNSQLQSQPMVPSNTSSPYSSSDHELEHTPQFGSKLVLPSQSGDIMIPLLNQAASESIVQIGQQYVYGSAGTATFNSVMFNNSVASNSYSLQDSNNSTVYNNNPQMYGQQSHIQQQAYGGIFNNTHAQAVDPTPISGDYNMVHANSSSNLYYSDNESSDEMGLSPEDLKRKRLKRKAELARASRLQKKTRLQELEAENDELRKRLVDARKAQVNSVGIGLSDLQSTLQSVAGVILPALQILSGQTKIPAEVNGVVLPAYLPNTPGSRRANMDSFEGVIETRTHVNQVADNIDVDEVMLHTKVRCMSENLRRHVMCAEARGLTAPLSAERPRLVHLSNVNDDETTLQALKGSSTTMTTRRKRTNSP